jgi:cytochrome P450
MPPNIWYDRKSWAISAKKVIDQKPGDAVRFQPNGLAFNSASAYRSIYSAKPPLKRGKLYETFPRNDAGRNTASTIEIPEHARKRRVLNTVFSDKTVRSAEQFIIKHVDRWCEIRLDGPDKEWSGPEVASDLADQLMFDIMGDLSFGRSFDIKERKENPFRDMPHIIGGFVKYLYVVSRRSSPVHVRN